MDNAEQQRINDNAQEPALWHRWGPYLSERQWGTVREDYSGNGNAWEYFPHDHARSRAYRWGEDGLGGICDRHGFLCFAVALWNGRDPILKERLFGLANGEGNHGEDVKEAYFYLDNTPTHSYMAYLYKYPHAPFPYADLIETNRKRGQNAWEYELADTGIFDEGRYTDVLIEYAKNTPEDIFIRVTVTNRSDQQVPLVVLPTLWFRNTWSWGYDVPPSQIKLNSPQTIEACFERYGSYFLFCADADEWVFTENETNHERLYGQPNPTPFVKDAFHRYIIAGEADAVNPAQTGTKAAAICRLTLPPHESRTLRLRFQPSPSAPPPNDQFDALFAQRKAEADAFYEQITPDISPDMRMIQRQAFAGLLWNKQFFHYDVKTWLNGDPQMPAPSQRKQGRNAHWTHVYASEILSMPDKWEYPWFAAWDTAFHCIPLALIDPAFAKNQLLTLLREWYLHPNGQLPAYEWAFDDVNPPVHAWAAMRVYQIEQKNTGKGDRAFLEKVFHKLLLNFTWWVNRKDEYGNNVFEGGFLGLDNIGVFDRNEPLQDGTRLEQADGTSWMAMYSLNMLTIALELAQENPAYEDVASKFFEHFLFIADAMNHIGQDSAQLWDEADGFFYDVLHRMTGEQKSLKVRSMVGLIPLFAVMTFEADILSRFPGFRRRMEWFLEHRPEWTKGFERPGESRRRMLSVVRGEQLERILRRMLDETEFLSPYGIRSLSRYHAHRPYSLELDGRRYTCGYEPAESLSRMFGGNSNWRGPVWFPLNYLLIESLQKFDYYYGTDFQMECPTGSGRTMTLWEVSVELSRRLIGIFAADENGNRACFGGQTRFRDDPHWQNLLLFHEYFHGDNGAGLGACQQTGWTSLVAKLIQQSGK
jgi:hypothetical protein